MGGWTTLAPVTMVRRLLLAGVLHGTIALAGCADRRPTTATPTTAPAESRPSASLRGFSRAALEQALRGDGLRGWVHGARASQAQWVLTYRDPEDFFHFLEFGIVPGDEAVARRLATWGRHDRVTVWGEILDYPQLHLRVTAVERNEPYEGFGNAGFTPAFDPRRDLAPEGRVMAKVHAVDPEGPALVVEIGDAVVPVRVPASLAQGLAELARGDTLDLRYRVASHPGAPLHLALPPDDPRPWTVVVPIRAGHGAPIVVEGALVRFPRSPQIAFDVFAVEVIDEHGLATNYTLVNFEDPELFAAVRERLGAAWHEHEATTRPARNRFVNPQLRVRVRGTKNVVDPNQANPQVLLDSIDDVEFAWQGG